MIPPVLVGFLLLGFLLAGTLLLSTVSERVEQVLTRIGLSVFREAVESQGRYRERRKRHLQSIHATVTYPVYASKTLLYSGIAGVAGSLIGASLIWFVLAALAPGGEASNATATPTPNGTATVNGTVTATANGTATATPTPNGTATLPNATTAPTPTGTTTANATGIRGDLPEFIGFLVPGADAIGALSIVQIFVLLLVSAATVGTLAGGLVYYGRWWRVRSRTRQRGVLIDESVPRTIAFIYALSRSGMVYPEIMRTVADNRRSFGESAEEVSVVVKDMDLFGADLVAALERIAGRTPSEQFADFAENFASVLRTGRNVSEYLREQYDQYQEERVSNQERLLELFTALGEGYVAALVALPLFLITILLVFGILTGGMLRFLRAIIYFLIPVANVGFVLYLDSISESLTAYRTPITEDTPSRKLHVRRAGQGGEAGLTDGGVSPGGDGGAGRADAGVRAGVEREMNRIRLSAYNRFRALYDMVVEPVESLVAQPIMLFYVTVPLVVVASIVRLWPILATPTGGLDGTLRAVDDIVIQAILVIVATFAVVQELHAQRLSRIESAIPDLLDRLASTNEAGMTFTEALERTDRSDLGALDEEVSKLLADVEWGARTERALYRFGTRVKSRTVSRVVALITNAMNASGNIGPVIRIAADEAREDRRLKKQRSQEMFMYVLIIYISFFVFLGIGLALQQILIPAIPSADQLGGIAPNATNNAPGVGNFGGDLGIDPVQGEEKDKYTLVLYHAAMVQAICSGLVAGKMGEGSIRDGAKHVAIMLAVVYAVFLVIGA